MRQRFEQKIMDIRQENRYAVFKVMVAVSLLLPLCSCSMFQSLIPNLTDSPLLSNPSRSDRLPIAPVEQTEDTEAPLECDLEAIEEDICAPCGQDPGHDYTGAGNPAPDWLIAENDIVSIPPPHPLDIKYSKRFGFHLDGMENEDLMAEVSKWLRTPFQMGGCSTTGVDCSCLVKKIYKKAYGIDLERTTVTIFDKDLMPVDKDELREGDILGFRIQGNKISHIGIYLKAGKFVHASRSNGVIISDLSKTYYRKRFVRAGRIRSEPEEIYIAMAEPARPMTRRTSRSRSIRLGRLSISESANHSILSQ